MQLSAPQHIFLNELGTKFRAYVGGFGSGKTWVGCHDLQLFAARHPKTVQGYFGPSYPAIRDIFYPTFEESAHSLGFRCVIHHSNKEVDLYRGRWWYGKIICRSMDKPASIIGFKIARALVDEIDTLPTEKAKLAWNKILARLRLLLPGVVNSIGVTTTPEGFRFVYSQFADNPTESYSMVQASTYENLQYLPPDYIPTLCETYTSQLVLAYVGGQFVNLTTGTVYYSFDRKMNHSNESADEHEPLYVGMDFNVGKMAAIAHVKRNDKTIAVHEWLDKMDTPHMIECIQEDFPQREIYVYPDASGRNRSTSSRKSTMEELSNDISLLEQAGFYVNYNTQNPRIKARVTAVNSMFCNAKHERKYLVNTFRCPRYTKCLGQQAYDEHGNPDKSNDLDHPNDAAGYYIAHDYPVDKPIIVPIVRRY